MNVDPQAIAEMFETVSLGAPENAVGFVMWRIVHRYQREVEQALRDLDLTHLQFVTLTLVAWMTRRGDVTTQAELARFGDIHPMQVSNVLSALAQKSLIERAPAGSGRAKTVAITAAGLTTLRQAIPLVIDVQARIFGEQGRPGGRLLDTLAEIDRQR